MTENVLQIPTPPNEPVLVELAPAGYMRAHGYIGLVEAIAWVGSRDGRLSSAVHSYQYEKDGGQDDIGRAALRDLLNQDLFLCGSSFSDAERQFFEGCCDLPALGRFDGANGNDEVPVSVFAADLRVANELPDALTLKGRGVFGKPMWSHIRFNRADVLARWPANGEAVPSPTIVGVETAERTGDPGRPELGTSLYVAEFERRVVAGVIAETLAEEARALLRWFRETHQERQPPTEKTIKNRIRYRFNQARN